MQQLTQSKVPGNFNTIRLDKYLAERFSYQSRTAWRREIESGNISVNGIQTLNHHKIIKPGDLVSFTGADYKEPDVEKNFSILYEDEYLIAANKPANLPVHPAGIFFKNTLLYLLEGKYSRKFYTLHRIDRETSGIVLFAKNQATASGIQTNFNDVSKTYIAIVHGVMGKNHFTVNVPIGDNGYHAVMKKRSAYSEAPEQAETLFKKIYTFGDFTLIKAIPITGRQHQIRVHLEHIGHPILGDKIYGLDENFYLEFIKSGYSDTLVEKLQFKRSALHSRSIRFYHPDLKRYVFIKSPIPEDMRGFLIGKGSDG